MLCWAEQVCNTSSSPSDHFLKYLLFVLLHDWQLLLFFLIITELWEVPLCNYWMVSSQLFFIFKSFRLFKTQNLVLETFLSRNLAAQKKTPADQSHYCCQIFQDQYRATITPFVDSSICWSSLSRHVSAMFLLHALQDCKMELNDEEGHRCYPLNGHLLCHSCHLKHIQPGRSSSVAAASY